MQLTPVDLLVIALYFAFNLGVALYLRRRATQSVSDFFVSGRNVSWWLAGTSMVATTFAADTPPGCDGARRQERHRGDLDLVEHGVQRDAYRVLNVLTEDSYESCDPAMGANSVRTLLCRIYLDPDQSDRRSASASVTGGRA